jgi:hypothetical protein
MRAIGSFAVNLGGSLPIPCLRRFRRRQALAASHPVADGFAPAELDALPLMLGDCAVCGSVHSTTLPSPRHYVKRTARLYFQRAVPSLVYFRSNLGASRGSVDSVPYGAAISSVRVASARPSRYPSLPTSIAVLPAKNGCVRLSSACTILSRTHASAVVGQLDKCRSGFPGLCRGTIGLWLSAQGKLRVTITLTRPASLR